MRSAGAEQLVVAPCLERRVPLIRPNYASAAEAVTCSSGCLLWHLLRTKPCGFGSVTSSWYLLVVRVRVRVLYSTRICGGVGSTNDCVADQRRGDQHVEAFYLAHQLSAR